MTGGVLTHRGDVSAEPSEPTAGDPGARPSRRSRGPDLGYQPALDGIRAFAVGGVILFHFGVDWMGGGFLGVDTFFVLSGFLITYLLLTEQRRDGHIGLKAFWIRRARRLLPALFLVLGAVALYAAVLAEPEELANIRGDGLASLFYVANWRFIVSGQSYFEAFTAPSPLQHMWSLAIEEQWYVVWPLVVTLVLGVWHRSARFLTGLIAVLALGSAGLMAVLYSPTADPSRVYYGTDTHAQSILVGALLATIYYWYGPLRSAAARTALTVAAIMGVLVSAWLWVGWDDQTTALYRGGFLLAAVSTALVVATVVQPMGGGLLGALLSLSWLRWVGKISYGLYLWHWPVYVALRTQTDLADASLLAVGVALTFAFATLSYYLVEMPIRRGGLRRWGLWRLTPVAAGVLVVALVLSTAGAGDAVARPDREEAEAHVEERLAELEPPPTTAPAPAPAAQDDARADAQVPVVPPRVLVVGDSLAENLGRGLEELAGELGIVALNAGLPGCTMADGHVDALRAPDWSEQIQVIPAEPCESSWAAVTGQYVPSEVVLLHGGRAASAQWRIDGTWRQPCDPEFQTWYEQRVRAEAAAFVAAGAQVDLVVTPRSQFPLPPEGIAQFDCLNGVHRRVATSLEGVELVDLDAWVCPGGTCRTDLVTFDGVHYEPESARVVARWLGEQVAAT